MSTTTERTPFIAPLVDKAAQFIKERGAAAISELAEYLSAAGINVSGDAELTGEELAYYWRREELQILPVIASGSGEFVWTIAALLVNRTVDLDTSNLALLKLTWYGDLEASEQKRVKSHAEGHLAQALRRGDGRVPEALHRAWRKPKANADVAP
ncbi:MAG: hypothetical protein WBW75_07950 [Mycobacterium sp.]|uniref:hypothetical protein n=1 Tax=Mycobacterium sp. TaxID=1785 RepID=UPI003C583D62